MHARVQKTPTGDLELTFPSRSSVSFRMKEILSDQGTNFRSQLLKELNLLHIQLRTSPYHPQMDGLVELFKQTVKAMLKKLVNSSWDSMLLNVLFAYKEVPQSTTGFSPFELLYGREVRGPLDTYIEGRMGSGQEK